MDNDRYTLVSAVLANATARRVVDQSPHLKNAGTLSWKARGTILHEHWLKSFFPPISPAKTMLQTLVPTGKSATVVNNMVELANLHRQATGAVFSTVCDHCHFGPQFDHVPGEDTPATQQADELSEDLAAIYCIVEHQLSPRIAKGAINAGAHGPIVYYAEGRGLRDRLGWLRITKEQEKEVLLVVCDQSDADAVFDAMAKVGQMHLPGRGFMYRTKIERGIFNLPSRAPSHHYAASMQQVINAIDHLNGHSHWRDNGGFDVGTARGAGISLAQSNQPRLRNQQCLTVVAPRNDASTLADVVLDAGAPGLNISYAILHRDQQIEHESGAMISEDYAVQRCITDDDTAYRVRDAVIAGAEQLGLQDYCVYGHQVPEAATYVPGKTDYRAKTSDAA